MRRKGIKIVSIIFTILRYFWIIMSYYASISFFIDSSTQPTSHGVGAGFLMGIVLIMIVGLVGVAFILNTAVIIMNAIDICKTKKENGKIWLSLTLLIINTCLFSCDLVYFYLMNNNFYVG